MFQHGQNIQAFLFDLDGTLVDTEIIYVKAVYQLLREEDYPMSYDDVMELVYGKSWQDILRYLLMCFPHLGRNEVGAKVRRSFQSIRGNTDILIHSSIALLKELAASCPVCIVSGSSRKDVAHHIDLMSVSDYLVFYLGAEDYHPGKPDPSCYILAAERLQIPPSRCLVFEDSQAGVEAAKSAGMSCVALRKSDGVIQDLSGADIVLSDLKDFLI